MAATAISAPRTAAALGADLRTGRLDAVELAERTLAAINSHSDKAIFAVRMEFGSKEDIFFLEDREEAIAFAQVKAKERGGLPIEYFIFSEDMTMERVDAPYRRSEGEGVP